MESATLTPTPTTPTTPAVPGSLTFICDYSAKVLAGLGWRVKDQPNFDALTGLTVAHDLMEHHPGGDAGPTDEMLAFGGTLYLRVGGGMAMASSWARGFAKEFLEVLEHMRQEGGEIAEPTAEAKAAKAQLPYTEQEALSVFVKLVTAHADWVSILMPRAQTWSRAYTREQAERAAPWIALGWLKARERYAGLDPRRLTDLFVSVEHNADHILTAHSKVGDELEFQPDYPNYRIRMIHRRNGQEIAPCGAWAARDRITFDGWIEPWEG